MSFLQTAVSAFFVISSLLLVKAPATLLDAGLDSVTAGRLRLVTAEGTLWSGQGRLEIRDAASAAVFSSPVTWSLQKSQLLLARVSVNFSIAEQVLPSTATVKLSSLKFIDLEFTHLEFGLPAAAVAQVMAQLLPATKGYGVGGMLSVLADALTFSRTATTGSIVLQWQDASSILAPVSPLGSYELRLDGSPAPAQFSVALQTLHGPLQLDGGGRVGASQQAALSVTARLPPAEYVEMAPLLQLIAVESSDGSFLLQL